MKGKFTFKINLYITEEKLDVAGNLNEYVVFDNDLLVQIQYFPFVPQTWDMPPEYPTFDILDIRYEKTNKLLEDDIYDLYIEEIDNLIWKKIDEYSDY